MLGGRERRREGGRDHLVRWVWGVWVGMGRGEGEAVAVVDSAGLHEEGWPVL